MKEPFINNMFPGIERPYEPDYRARTKNITIYEHHDSLGPCSYCGDEDCAEECEDALEDKEEADLYRDKDQPPIPKIDLSKVSLQDLLNLLPEGVKPEDVKIRMSIEDNAHAYTSHGVSFYYKKKFPADPEGLKAAKKKYAECEAAYQVKRDEYDAWVKEQEIQALEEKLSRLKR